MARKKKPSAFPDYLFDLEQAFPGEGDRFCLWLCSGCGAPYHFRKQDGKHGGPAWRIKEHPEWSPYEGPCWRSHEYGVKCSSPRGIRVLMHEGYSPPGEDLMKALASSARRVRAQLKRDDA